MERTNDILAKKTLTAVCLALVTSAGWANDGHDLLRFQATLQTTSQFFPGPAAQCTNPSTVLGLLKAVGPGDTNLLGVVTDEQSHCVRKGTSFDGGKFTLTNPQGKTIEGRYYGKIVKTFNSTQDDPPLGVWQVEGNVCIVKVAGRVVSDCSHPSRNHYRANGIVNFDPTIGNPATIFIDQWIRF
jgi:hypothetical protein